MGWSLAWPHLIPCFRSWGASSVYLGWTEASASPESMPVALDETATRRCGGVAQPRKQSRSGGINRADTMGSSIDCRAPGRWCSSGGIGMPATLHMLRISTVLADVEARGRTYSDLNECPTDGRGMTYSYAYIGIKRLGVGRSVPDRHQQRRPSPCLTRRGYSRGKGCCAGPRVPARVPHGGHLTARRR
jgi:hypothetical protein